MRPIAILLGATSALTALSAASVAPSTDPTIAVMLAWITALGLVSLSAWALIFLVPGGPKPSRHYRKRVRARQ